MRDRPVDCPKQIIRRYRLGQNVSRTRLDGLYRDWDIDIASEENDWQRRTEFGQALLQCRAVHVGYPHVEEDATRNAFGRQVDQQMQGRRIGRDLVPGML